MAFNLSDIENKLKDRITREISLGEEGVNRFRVVLAQFSDIGEKQFSTLLSNRERIKTYLSEQLA